MHDAAIHTTDHSIDPVMPLDMLQYEDKLGLPEARSLWTPQAILETRLHVEAVISEVQAELGIIPAEAAQRIRAVVDSGAISVNSYVDTYHEKGQEVAALVKVLADACADPWGQYVHWGVTTQDVLWTSTAVQIKKSLSLLDRELELLEAALSTKIKQHRKTIMPGRTQGQHGPPITFGWYLAIQGHAVRQHRERLIQLQTRLLHGKINGAVGTAAAYGNPETALELQHKVSQRLGLSTPIISELDAARDGMRELGANSSLITRTVEKFARDLWTMQRPELGEINEPFAVGRQVGSSTLPHKRNPIKLAWIQGACQLVNTHASMLLQSISFDLRDAIRFAPEYSALPAILVSLPRAVQSLTEIVEKMSVNNEQMRKNFLGDNAIAMDEAVMLELARRGLGRQDAHAAIYKITQTMIEQGTTLKAALREDQLVTQYLTDDDIERLLEPENYLGTTDKQIDNVLDLLARPTSHQGEKQHV